MTQAADLIWECLVEQTNDEQISAAIMGYFRRESGYRSNSITGWYLTKQPVCEEFTESLYGLDEEEFIKHIQGKGGYGLGGWYSIHHLRNFYRYFNRYGYDYDDLEAQCKFVIWGIKQQNDLWEELRDARDAETAGRILAWKYDGASEISCGVIGSYAKMIYKERTEK